jgi:autotransporter-associated beta strand protein
VELFNNGTLSIAYHMSGSPIGVGSIEGDGYIFLGSNNLTVGRNGLSTTFSGVIRDGTPGRLFGRGSITKIGRGNLLLRHRNTYSGGTIVKNGTLVINNVTGSGTGTGPVQIEGGKLAGKGIIAGAVTVGTASGPGAVLSPGYLHGPGSPGALTIQSPLTFNSDATYEIEVNSSRGTADEVVALGVTINSGAQVLFVDLGNGTFAPGSVLTVINNTSATPIAGTFSNLPNDSTFSSNGNSYQVNYQGGDGNDLTLTVVP